MKLPHRQGCLYVETTKHIHFLPTATLDEGILLPFMRNTSAWLRMAVGHNFGDATSALGNEYFGGFQNNYVNVGAQLNLEVVLFNYLKTTWSAGYARIFSQQTS